MRKRGWGKDLSLLIFKLKFERAEFSREEGGEEVREEGGGRREIKTYRFLNIIISLLNYPSPSFYKERSYSEIYFVCSSVSPSVLQ